jgi:Ca-activated chloride channel family protein
MQRDLVADADLRARFEQEARVGAQIESDHVVQVVGAGVDVPTGLPWIAMELLKGVPLDIYLHRRGARPPGEVRFLFEQLCHALGAAHERGIIHRDLKPPNIFLSTSRVVGLSYVVKVLDFGIAKMLTESKTTKTAAVGTPLYMAPEQYEAGHVCPATDVWALGLIAFELLTGRSYWKAAKDGSATPATIMYETCLGDLVPPSSRCVDLGVTADLPAGFDEWFCRCVQRKPDLRFLDARLAFESLAAVLGETKAPTEALPVAANETPVPATQDMTPMGPNGTVGMARAQATEIASLQTHPSLKLGVPATMPLSTAKPVVARVAPAEPVALKEKAPRSNGRMLGVIGVTALVGFLGIGGTIAYVASKWHASQPPPTTKPSPDPSASTGDVTVGVGDPTRFSAGSDVLVEGRLLNKKLPPLGATETYAMVDLRGADATPSAKTPVHLALVIDRSGSMKGGRLTNALAAAKLAMDRLRDGDTISVVAFDQSAQTIVAPTVLNPSTRVAVADSLKTVGLGGNTCISCGLANALAALSTSPPDTARRILLLSDGEANTGVKDLPGFQKLGRDAATGDVSITSIGLGDDYDPKSLTTLSRESNGMHFYASSDAALPPILEQQANALTSVLATGSEVAIRLAPNVRLLSVLDRANRIDTFGGVTTIHVPLGQFTRNERKTVLIKIAVDSGGAPGSAAGSVKAAKIADVSFTYKAAGASSLSTYGGSLTLPVASSGESIDLDPIVEDRVQRSETAAALLEADALFSAGKTKAAEDVLTKQSNALAVQNNKFKASAKPAPTTVISDVAAQQKAVDEANGKYKDAEKAGGATGAKPQTMTPAKEASKKANEDAYNNAY